MAFQKCFKEKRLKKIRKILIIVANYIRCLEGIVRSPPSTDQNESNDCDQDDHDNSNHDNNDDNDPNV